MIELWIAALEEIRQGGISNIQYSVPELIALLEQIRAGQQIAITRGHIN
jgi:hypothetical protein